MVSRKSSLFIAIRKHLRCACVVNRPALSFGRRPRPSLAAPPPSLFLASRVWLHSTRSPCPVSTVSLSRSLALSLSLSLTRSMISFFPSLAHCFNQLAKISSESRHYFPRAPFPSRPRCVPPRGFPVRRFKKKQKHRTPAKHSAKL